MRLRKVIVKRITVIKFGQNDGGGDCTGCFRIKVMAYTRITRLTEENKKSRNILVTKQPRM